MAERDKILGRIREALTVPAPYPTDSHSSLPPLSTGSPSTETIRRCLPPVGQSLAERLELFTKSTAALRADFQLLANRDELLRHLCALRDAEGWRKVGTHSGVLTDDVAARLGLPFCRTDQPYEVGELESCSVGLTQCDALVAQTGSVLVTSRSAGGRALSVLPPHHVVLARREQLLADLPAAFELLKQTYAPNYPSFISFITGPSRTGDIERILVLGAHGPKKLTILCI
ncbi:MAG TPA: lactate utilization protein [Patescibacteria group bacterium]|jgi:L-lactate dehydrogenase complex protein LldG|nr:lactate utilization protein [Patescibacteria group bacterium]